MNAPKARDPLADAVAVMGALPVPVGPDKPAGLSPELYATIAEQLGDVKPARDDVLTAAAEALRDMAAHDHQSVADIDWYCQNLAYWLVPRTRVILRRLLDAEAERAALRARVAELESAAKEIRRLHTDSPMGPCPVCVDEDALVKGDDYTVPWPCPTARHAGAAESRPVDEDPIAYSLTQFVEALHASSGAVIEVPTLPRAAAEDPHDSPLPEQRNGGAP